MVKHAGLLNKLHARIADRGTDLCSEPGDIHLVLNICLHLADISNPARPIEVAVRWAKRIQEEFWAQGDLMREHAMDVPPMHDRAHAEANVTFESQSQIGFTQFLVKPLLGRSPLQERESPRTKDGCATTGCAKPTAFARPNAGWDGAARTLQGCTFEAIIGCQMDTQEPVGWTWSKGGRKFYKLAPSYSRPALFVS